MHSSIHGLAGAAVRAEAQRSSPAALASAVSVAGRREEEFAAFLPDAYLFTDEYGVIRSANNAALDLLGRAEWTVVGKPLPTFVKLDDRKEFRSALSGVLHAASALTWHACFATPGGAVDAILTVGASHNENGVVRGVRWLIRPDTARDRVARTETQARALIRPPHALRGSGRGAVLDRLLAQASALLATSFDYELTLRSVAQLAVPTLADWCLIDLLGGDGTVRRLAAARASTEDARLGRAVLAMPPDLGNDCDPIARVLGGGPTEVMGLAKGEQLDGFSMPGAGGSVLDRLKAHALATYPLRARGHTIGAITLVMARSRRPFAQPQLSVAREIAERAALAADNARLYQAVRQASETKSAFLAMMSHELRTPLTAIIGYAELLRDEIFGGLRSEQRQPVDRIRQSSEHLLVLVDEILSFARLEARQDRIMPERTDIGSLVDQAVALVTPQAQRRGIELSAERSAGPMLAVTDPGKVRQILVNLLTNAVKFTEHGSVRLHAWSEGSEIGFDVSDTGIGIPPEMLPHIFDPFWQVDPKLTRLHGGAGLGLSVVRELARLLGGDVEVQSTPGEGSCFNVRIQRDVGAT
ncbi:MAG TPA: ATP-binding protein [Gemmatimonadaceae bacterium]|nr:ATP-binding protein [Gemmatimonadaceae bacterium]